MCLVVAEIFVQTKMAAKKFDQRCIVAKFHQDFFKTLIMQFGTQNALGAQSAPPKLVCHCLYTKNSPQFAVC
jgi:hypothetical protein